MPTKINKITQILTVRTTVIAMETIITAIKETKLTITENIVKIIERITANLDRTIIIGNTNKTGRRGKTDRIVLIINIRL